MQHEFKSANTAQTNIWSDARSIPIKNCKFSVRVKNGLTRSHIKTLGVLAAQMPNDLLKIRNLGRKCIKEITQVLHSHGLEFGESAAPIPLVPVIGSTLTDTTLNGELIIYDGLTYLHTRNRSRLSEKTRNLLLGQIHLDLEIDRLALINVRTLGQLMDQFASGLPKLKTVGRRSMMRMQLLLNSIDQSIDGEGNVDWTKFSQFAGLRMLPPPGRAIKSGRDFLQALPLVVDALVADCTDPIEGDILKERIVPNYIDGLTLEELGKRHGLTRERIRQKQTAVLNTLSSAALEGIYSGLKYRFTDDFRPYWISAAKYFGEKETVNLHEFIAGLSTAWNVEVEEIIPQLPLIYAILTNNSTLPPEFRPGFISISRALRNLGDRDTLGHKLVILHPTRTFRKFCYKREIFTVGDLINGISNGNLNFTFTHKPAHLAEAQEIIKALGAALGTDGLVSWQKYAEHKRLILVPNFDVSSPEEFVTQIVKSLAVFVDKTKISLRSKLIFESRIVPDSISRKTQAQIGKVASTSAEIICIEEDRLLTRLSDVLFKNKYEDCVVRFRPSFIAYWLIAKQQHELCSDIQEFAKRLSQLWGISYDTLRNAIPLLDAVITGRPRGYTGKQTLRSDEDGMYSDSFDDDIETSLGNSNLKQDMRALPVIVRLRGFRYVY